MARRLLLVALLAQPLACAGVPPRRERPGDRFRRVHLGTLSVGVPHLDPIVPIFRAALAEALTRTPGIVEVRDIAPGHRPGDAVLLRGELVDDLGPLVPVAAAPSRALAGRFELVAPDDTVVQRFVGLQRYAGGPGVAAFSAQGLIDLALLFARTVAGAVGRWLDGGGEALGSGRRTPAGDSVTRPS